MKRYALAFLLMVASLDSAIAQPKNLNTSAIDTALGRSGQLMAGGVYRVAFPRTDLRVSVGNVNVSPGLALGGYAAFVPEPQGTLAVGDVVLLESEIEPVMQSLKASHFEITALHNHLRNESPHVMYLHFMALGPVETVAKQLHDALALSHTPLGPVSANAPQTLSFQNAVERAIGRKGRVSGAILSIGVPRAETITMHGMTIPPAAGVATALNFQDAGNGNVATTGDFVLIGSEVEPVQSALVSHGIEVTALHHHMIDDSPHLYYMHFWAVGEAAKIGSALKEALSHTNVVEPQ